LLVSLATDAYASLVEEGRRAHRGLPEAAPHLVDGPGRLGPAGTGRGPTFPGPIEAELASSARLRASGLTGRTVTVKVRFHDHATITRSHTGTDPLDTGPELVKAASSLLAQVDSSNGVRLLGVSVSGLATGGARQLSLDWAGEGGAAAGPGWAQASRAVDEVRSRFGEAAVGPAALLDERGVRVRRKGDQQWGPSAGTDRGKS